MEIRDFAEQVLFARTLGEKLADPGLLTDLQPGLPLRAPAAPGRPAALEFKPSGSSRGAGAPPVHRLGDERERGRLLHFFANHELLATELMALVLLRFPDAPTAFRRGVVQTLRDEQEHTRMYLDRMRACGIAFGELPVSGYFWRAVSPMESPLEFVTGLSLTFEQANLDFCRHFAGCFTEVGDTDTAGLLDRIYRDEIAHVAHGLKWFRRWKDPEADDWDAYCGQLQFPLSPARARGIGFNAEGRRAAGLDASFIARLQVHAASKGRTPGVFLFNPLTEEQLAAAGGSSPGRAAAALARDLGTLPQFLARRDDVVLVAQAPSTAFLGGIQAAGFPLPEFCLIPGGRIGADHPLRQRKLGRLRPWSWGPEASDLLAPLMPQLTEAGRALLPAPDGRYTALYSKSWSAGFLRELLTSGQAGDPGSDWLCPPEVVGITIRSEPEALDTIARLRSAGFPRLVAKAPLGLAGRGHLRLWEPELLPQQQRWLERALSRGLGVVLEPWLDRVADFSVQWEHGPEGLRLVGYCGLQNDARGQFVANWAEPRFHRKPPAAVFRRLPETGAAHGRIQRWYDTFRELLEPRLRSFGFTGPLGVDALVYRDAAGRCRLKPVVEINPRYTMGRLTLELLRQAAPGIHGLFELVSRTAMIRSGCVDFAEYARNLSGHSPIRMGGPQPSRLQSGALCLNDPSQATDWLAVFHAGDAGLIARRIAESGQ
ncbi:MAG: DUF455 family protein [Verrucomicrobia bacterium]|nr:DUF455 family protein [Verrucomicrobiota bacterium]